MSDEHPPIPSEFFENSETEAFRNCKICERDLHLGDCDYMIEKAVRIFPEVDGREVVFEYAICMDCAMKARQSLSKESRNKIDELLQSTQVRQNTFEAMTQGLVRGNNATGYCMLTGKRMEDVKSFQIYAYCREKHLIQGSNAFMLSDEAMEIIAGLLSEETKDELDHFKETHFGVPPELQDLINSRDLVLF